MPDHSFVVPAYGRSEHLEACLQSLRAQTVRSQLIVTTSTPCQEQMSLAAKYEAQYFTHSPNRGIGHDWNFALSQAVTKWVTIAHQDDVYYPSFTEKTLSCVNGKPDAIMAFTNYDEIIDNNKRSASPLLVVKRALLEFGFLGRSSIESKFAKTNCLRFGNSIPCPSVTINTAAMPFQFDTQLEINLDWAAWLTLAKANGEFAWIRGEAQMAHRIHRSSETTASIADGRRRSEDLKMLETLWPRPIARLIARSYETAYTSNQH